METESIIKEIHTTCDGCEMFQDCGCMLDDSCPECSEHHLWTPKEQSKGKGVNLKELERRLDDSLAKETKESLNKFLSKEQPLVTNDMKPLIYYLIRDSRFWFWYIMPGFALIISIIALIYVLV